MKWTKQQKIACGILALAAGAFVVDRTVLSADSTDGAAAAAPGAVSGPSVRQVAAAARRDAVNEQPPPALARRLVAVAAAEGVADGDCPDGFRPPAEWFPAATVGASPAAPAAPEFRGPTAAERAAAFTSKHKLTAVMRSVRRPELGVAVIDKRTLRVGQAIDGFTLAAVHDRHVVLTDGQGATASLELPRPDVASVD